MMLFLTGDALLDEFTKYYARVCNELIIKRDDLKHIEAVYIRSPQEFYLYSYYCKLANGNRMDGPVKNIGKDYYRDTPDWYFLEKDKGYDDLDYYGFETLSEKKETFNAFIKELDDIVEVATCS